MASYKTDGIRGKKHGGTSKFIDSSESPHRRAKQEFSASFGSIKKRCVHIRTQHSGDDRIHTTPDMAHSTAKDFVREATAALLAP